MPSLKSVRVVAAALAVLACSGASAAPAGIPPEGIRVASVDVRGNRLVNRETILSAVTARVGRVITAADLERDVTRLRRLGYFQSVSAPEVTLTPEGARITYVVEEYPRVEGVTFTGNTVLSDDELRAIVGVERGQLLNREALNARLRAIENAYRARGYLARVGDAQVSGAGVVTIPIREVHVADVIVTGLERVRPAVVQRALELNEGELFNEQALQRDFVRLQQFNVFETIEPEVGFNAAGDAVVTWNLKEGRTRSVNFGLSYSPSESLVGTVAFIENNFRGRVEQLRVLLNFGTVEGKIGGEIGYATPVLARDIAYNARLFSTVEYRFTQQLLAVGGEGTGRYFERHNGLQLGATRNLGGGRRVLLSGRYENVRVANLPPQFLSPGIPRLDSALLVGTGQLILDRRNSILYPTTGTYVSGTADAGWVTRGSEGGSGPLVKPQAEWRSYIPLDRVRARSLNERERQRTRVLAYRLMAGTTLGDLPFFEQYFVGGVDSLRGYREDRYWGSNMLVGNAELRWPLGGNIVGAGFVDAGYAWGSDFQFTDAPGFSTDFRQSRSPALRLGAGIGVRYLSPLGALRLDFARGDRFRVHFTLGEMF